MKTTLLICAVFFATQCHAQKYIVGIDLDAFSVFDYGASSSTIFPSANSNSSYKQFNTILAPMFSFQKIKKNKIVYGLELGFYRYNLQGSKVTTSTSNTNLSKGVESGTRYMYMFGANCSKVIQFDKFIFIAGIHIPFGFSPTFNYKANDSLFDASTNTTLRWEHRTGQMPKQFSTGLRFRNELNYPLYKKLYIATKLNFGFDYQHNFGLTIYKSEYFDGANIDVNEKDVDYKKMDLYSKHFSYSAGLNYFF
jgi:hypothetical protein